MTVLIPEKSSRLLVASLLLFFIEIHTVSIVYPKRFISTPGCKTIINTLWRQQSAYRQGRVGSYDFLFGGCGVLMCVFVAWGGGEIDLKAIFPTVLSTPPLLKGHFLQTYIFWEGRDESQCLADSCKKKQPKFLDLNLFICCHHTEQHLEV